MTNIYQDYGARLRLKLEEDKKAEETKHDTIIDNNKAKRMDDTTEDNTKDSADNTRTIMEIQGDNKKDTTKNTNITDNKKGVLEAQEIYFQKKKKKQKKNRGSDFSIPSQIMGQLHTERLKDCNRIYKGRNDQIRSEKLKDRNQILQIIKNISKQ